MFENIRFFGKFGYPQQLMKNFGPRGLNIFLKKMRAHPQKFWDSSLENCRIRHMGGYHKIFRNSVFWENSKIAAKFYLPVKKIQILYMISWRSLERSTYEIA